MKKSKTTPVWKFAKYKGELNRDYKISRSGEIVAAATMEPITTYNMSKKSIHNRSDYQAVYLKGTSTSPIRAHTVICETFHGQAKPGQVVTHRNGLRDDNHPSNLVWTSQKDVNRRTSHPRYAAKVIKKVKTLLNKGFSHDDVATKTGMSDSNVASINSGYTHIAVLPLTAKQLEYGNVI